VGELRTILPYFRPYTRGLVLGLVCVFFANVSQIAAPYLMKLAIDGLGAADVTAGRVAVLGTLIVAAALVGGAFRYGMRELLNGISRRIEADLRNDFFRHLLGLDATYYGGTRTGDLMSRATNDTFAVRTSRRGRSRASPGRSRRNARPAAARRPKAWYRPPVAALPGVHSEGTTNRRRRAR
jgi:ATP-binding cassette subfamily B protein